jgi:putative DNA primase/helicase
MEELSQFKIQLLGLREYFNKKAQKHLKKHAFHDKQWQAPSVIDVFANLSQYLEVIPPEEHYNLYYTACNCLPDTKKPRLFAYQEIIPFDIDGIDPTAESKYVEVICDTLAIDPDETGIVFSGNGLQFIIGLKDPYFSEEVFDELRPYYRELCHKINKSLESFNLPGEADVAVWSSARLLRLPNTKNIKKDKGEKWARLIQRNIVRRDYDLRVASGLPLLSNRDQIKPSELKMMPKPDSPDVIMEGCEFLKWCRDNPGDVSEPQWYAMLSITARLEDGHELSHALSLGHKAYTRAETDEKISQSLRNSGPRTCDNINSMFDGCAGCENRGCVTSPILIKGPDYIGTEKTRFHQVTLTKDGDLKPGKPMYEDLRRYFERKHKYISTEANWIYVWNGTNWDLMPDSMIEAFAQTCFEDLSSQSKIAEFMGYVRRTNKKDSRFFIPPNGMMNFKNGVLDLSTKKFEPHSPVFGFRSTLPYDYDPEAKSPVFDQFMKDITCNRADLCNLLLEYMGFAFSNMAYRWHKALILTGEGSNGKSTFLEVMRELAGRDAYSSLLLNELSNDTKRFLMVGKLFNIAEETPKRGLGDSSIFKILVSGGAFDVKQLYKQPETIHENRTKLIMACNELPTNADPTHGLFRRLIIVPFDAIFKDGNIDYDIGKKLHDELPGIFNRVIEGYDRLMEQGRFTVCKDVDELIDEYRTSTDSVAEWLLDRTLLVEEDQAFTTSKALFDDYNTWCDQLRIRYPKGHIAFSKRVGAIVERKACRKKVQGEPVRGYKGIALKPRQF